MSSVSNCNQTLIHKTGDNREHMDQNEEEMCAEMVMTFDFPNTIFFHCHPRMVKQLRKNATKFESHTTRCKSNSLVAKSENSVMQISTLPNALFKYKCVLLF